MLNARAVATLGFGFSVAVVAALGLAPAQVAEVPKQAIEAAGGVTDDAGQGRIWRDNAWVKATKFAKVGISKQYPVSTESKVVVQAVPAQFRTQTPEGSVRSWAGRAGVPTQALMVLPTGMHNANNQVVAACTSLRTSSYNGACEVLSLDEILTLLELA
jgi:hypothetical protein